MKGQNIQDERVSAQRTRVNSEAFGILMLALLASVLVQQFLLNAPFGQYAVEFMCFIGMSLYVIIRFMGMGNNIYGEGRRAGYIPLVQSIVVGIVVTSVVGVSSYMQYSEKYNEDGTGYFIAVLAIVFVCSSLASFFVQSLLSFMNKKQQEKIQRQFDRDETEE